MLVLSPVDPLPRVRDVFKAEVALPFDPSAVPPLEGGQVLNYQEHQHDDVYYVLEGALYNDGDQAALVEPTHGQRFYAGAHPVTGEKILVPQQSYVEHGAYRLLPGQWALVQVVAGCHVERLASVLCELVHDAGSVVAFVPED